jgi:hypothetical protein
MENFIFINKKKGLRKADLKVLTKILETKNRKNPN